MRKNVGLDARVAFTAGYVWLVGMAHPPTPAPPLLKCLRARACRRPVARREHRAGCSVQYIHKLGTRV